MIFAYRITHPINDTRPFVAVVAAELQEDAEAKMILAFGTQATIIPLDAKAVHQINLVLVQS